MVCLRQANQQGISMKLHVGCGAKYLEGWTNLDIVNDNKIDIMDDASLLLSIEDESCDIIYASHILEHFGRHEWRDVLSVWQSKLKKGGVLRLAVPNFEKVVEYYSKTKDINAIMGLTIGGQRNAFDFHKIIFDEQSLSDALLEVGFSDIRYWDWQDTDHAEVDDYSQAYLPHMDKENGILMSLNLEAIK